MCSIALSAFIIVCVLNIIIKSHIDICFFQQWGIDILDIGTGSFYKLGYGSPTDYPPIYLLICALMAWICRLFGQPVGFEESSNLANFLFRLPSALMLVASIFVFYYLIKSFNISNKKALILTCVFAFAPALLWDIAQEAQVDCFIVFFILFSLLMFVKEKYFLSLLACTFGVLTKLQFSFVIPIIGFAVLHRMYKSNQLLKFFKYVAICIGIYVAVFTPFIYKELGEGRVFYIFEVTLKAVNHHSYFAFNTFNIYGALGLNLVKYPYPILFMIINIFIIAVIVSGSIILFVKNPTNRNLVLLTALTVISIYMLLTNMIDRYMLSIIGVMIIVAHITNVKKLIWINYYFYILQILWFIYMNTKFVVLPVYIFISVSSVAAFLLYVIEIIKFVLRKELLGLEGK